MLLEIREGLKTSGRWSMPRLNLARILWNLTFFWVFGFKFIIDIARHSYFQSGTCVLCVPMTYIGYIYIYIEYNQFIELELNL